MNKKKSLMIVNSIYQLLNAINLKNTILDDEIVDIVLTDVTSKLKDYIPRLNDCKMFRKVIFASVFQLNQEHAAAKEPGVSECFKNSESILNWYLNEELDVYDYVYFANYDIFTRILAYHWYDMPCEFIAFEDGFSSYVINYLDYKRAKINQHTDGIKIKDKVKRIYLYEPHLAVRNDNIRNIQLPKINRNNKELIEILNYVFDYQGMKDCFKFIFLEQSFRAEGIKGNDIELMKECVTEVGYEQFIVKPHPRNIENRSFNLGISSKSIGDAPWELFLLNGDFNNKIVITVCSNAALTSRIVFGMDINTVMLYELYNGKVLWKEDDILKQYLKKFKKQFAGENYYIPRTIFELRNTLKYLEHTI